MTPHLHAVPGRTSGSRRCPAPRAGAITALFVAALAAGCEAVPLAAGADHVRLPLLRGWFEGQEVLCVTTDVSHADVAQAKGANFSPRLADAPATRRRRDTRRPLRGGQGLRPDQLQAGQRVCVGAHARGYRNRDRAFSPLSQLVKVNWTARSPRRTLKSEEDIFSAAKKGEVSLEATRVVLNCPIVQRGPEEGGLPGVSIGRARPGH